MLIFLRWIRFLVVFFFVVLLMIVASSTFHGDHNRSNMNRIYYLTRPIGNDTQDTNHSVPQYKQWIAAPFQSGLLQLSSIATRFVTTSSLLSPSSLFASKDSENEISEAIPLTLFHNSSRSSSTRSSSTTAAATVIGLADGYDLPVFHRFVGSLRKTGYDGHIILGMTSGMEPLSSSLQVVNITMTTTAAAATTTTNNNNILHNYLQSRNVTVKVLQKLPCEYMYQDTYCVAPYPTLKIRWSRFPLALDWLRECDDCTGAVLVTDVRDVFFQTNPFVIQPSSSSSSASSSTSTSTTLRNDYDSANNEQARGKDEPKDTGLLHLFAEHPYQSTFHKLVRKPIRRCKGMVFHKPMICSGTIYGTREAMIQYLEIMSRELHDWSQSESCRLWQRQGGDQAVHNYLYYTGRFPPSVQVIPFRSPGSIVITVGIWGKVVQDMIRATSVESSALLLSSSSGNTHHSIEWTGGSTGSHGKSAMGTGTIGSWIDLAKWNVTDEEGYFVDSTNRRCSVVHQYDRFGWAGIDEWLQTSGIVDLDLP